MTDPSIYRRLDALERRLAELAAVDVRRPVGALYATDASQSIPTGGSDTVVNFEDLISDPDGLVATGANWAFTCPLAGLYLVSSAILFNLTTTFAATEAVILTAYRNGAASRRLCRMTDFSGANINAWAAGGAVISCGAGDTLDVRLFQNSGGALTLNNAQAFNYISIVKVN